MPRTRTDLDRSAKTEEILVAAERQLRAGGLSALSIAAIARELRLAQNAIYWYFPSKDHLFVAVLERMLRAIVARKPPQRGDVDKQLRWFVDQVVQIEHLTAAMREQARRSAVVEDFASQLDATWQTMLSNVLAERVPNTERAIVVDTLLATIQGLLAQRVSRSHRARVLSFALERLASGSDI